MTDLIKREDAIKAVLSLTMYKGSVPVDSVIYNIKHIPSAEPWDIYNPDEWCTDCKEYDTENHRCPRWNKVIRRTLEENQPKQGEWIPCSERLPEEEGIYLVTATNYIFDTEEIAVGTCYFNTEYGFSNNRKILAWMPLPDPWKGADNED